MRPVLRGELTPADAVRAYHDALAKAEITPHRAPPGRPGGDRPRAACRMSRGAGSSCAGSIVVDVGKIIDALPAARPHHHDRGGLAVHRRAGPEHGRRPAGARGGASRSACSARSATTSTAPSSSPSARGWASTRRASRRCPAWPPRSPTRWSSGTAAAGTFFHHIGANGAVRRRRGATLPDAPRILHVGAPGLHPLMDAPDRGRQRLVGACCSRARAAGMHTNMELVSLAPDRARRGRAAVPAAPVQHRRSTSWRRAR